MRSTVCAGAGGHMRRTTVFSVAGCRTGTATAGAARPARRARSPARRADVAEPGPHRASPEPAGEEPAPAARSPARARRPDRRRAAARPPRVSLPLTRTPGTTTRRSSRSRPWRCPKRPPRSPVPRDGKSNAAESARARSSSVAPTALTVRAAPRAADAGRRASAGRTRTAARRWRGRRSGTRGQRSPTGRPSSQSSTRRAAQPVKSAAVGACPTPGTMIRLLPGSAAAIRAEVSGGVRRSSPPCSSRAGTAG